MRKLREVVSVPKERSIVNHQRNDPDNREYDDILVPGQILKEENETVAGLSLSPSFPHSLTLTSSSIVQTHTKQWTNVNYNYQPIKVNFWILKEWNLWFDLLSFFQCFIISCKLTILWIQYLSDSNLWIYILNLYYKRKWFPDVHEIIFEVSLLLSCTFLISSTQP